MIQWVVGRADQPCGFDSGDQRVKDWMVRRGFDLRARIERAHIEDRQRMREACAGIPH